MCTATWWRDGEDYTLFFNRDELKTRSRAVPPELKVTEEGVGFITPTDPDAGGTWMLTNEHRVTVCVLNLWHHLGNKLPATLSRGKVVLSLADCTSCDDVHGRVKNMKLAGARPFTLLSLDKDGELVLEWDGEVLLEKKIQQPLTSSSFDFENVASARRDEFSKVEKDASSLSAYHQCGDENTAYTVRMCRPDAQTWSISKVEVSMAETLWEYQEELPELASRPPLHRVSLQRC